MLKNKNALLKVKARAIIPKIVGICIILVFSYACGFHVSSNNRSPQCKEIAIPVFKNATHKFGVEEVLTNATISEFLSRHGVKVVPVKSAKTILYGTVVGYSESNPLSFDVNENVMYYRLILTVDVVVRDLSKNKDIFTLKGLSVNVDYKVPQDVGLIEASEHEALTRAAQEMGEKIALYIFDWI